MRANRLDVSALEVSTFEVATKSETEPPQQVKTRCTQCTMGTDCNWTDKA